ncbi:hypothetical protein LOZ65_006393 [Ophidiomyces ophidiicola]|nr:hypothetical protein LOZ65_006393 [Ophidiomyces ophidiicola]
MSRMPFKRSRDLFEDEPQHQQSSQFVFYGTPLPFTDRQSRDDGSYVPIWKQEVTDERGRKRLHGAFTGGFSAGYFNTVGSKEGWSPSAFISSRQDRAKDKPQPVQLRPEDFMDAEDLQEAEDARKLHTTEDFVGFGSTVTDPRRAGLIDISKIRGDTMGAKLLKRMGWREGQGIGPKVRRKADLGVEGGSTDQTFLFAPENPPLVSFTKKKDYVGIGFDTKASLQAPLNCEGDLADGSSGVLHVSNVMKQRPNKFAGKKRKPLRRGGFGVGVLNDTGSDDDDLYEMGPQLLCNRVLEDRKRKSSKPIIKSSNPLLESKPVFIRKKADANKQKLGFQKCHDGRLPIDGFSLGTCTSEVSLPLDRNKYTPPKVPKDWASSKEQISTIDPAAYVSVVDAAKSSPLNPRSRATILGAAELPGKSVFDFITPGSREKLAKATGRTDLPPALGENPPEGFEVSESQKQKELWNLVPHLGKGIAIQALSRGIGGWMPYAEDESKRARYRAFLEVQAGITDTLPPRAPDASTKDWVTELHEFSRAAEVFKPIAGLMASRFTSSTSNVFQSSQAGNDPLLKTPVTTPKDPAEAAARLGIYGPMTRSVLRFSPTRLLYKRFNIPTTPVGTDAGNATSPTRDVPPKSVDKRNTALLSKNSMIKLMAEPKANPLPEFRTAKIDPNHNEVLEAARPEDAVFKAIFGSDDEDGAP